MSKPHFSILPSGPKVERKLQVAASSLPCGPLSTPLALAWRWESTPLGLRDHFWCLSAAGMWNINKALTLTHLRPLDGVKAILRRPVVMESHPRCQEQSGDGRAAGGCEPLPCAQLRDLCHTWATSRIWENGCELTVAAPLG